jgi:hypothetical protein
MYIARRIYEGCGSYLERKFTFVGLWKSRVHRKKVTSELKCEVN